jgi:nucleotide-binding universal stress UspA family protein
MKPSMTQRQQTDVVETFRKVLVYGVPDDTVRLLDQALPVIARAAEIHVIEPEIGRLDAGHPLETLLRRLADAGARVRRERTDAPDAAALVRRAGPRHDLVLKATAPGGGCGGGPDRLDLELLASSPSTVWLGRYGRGGVPRRVGAAIDCQDDDRTSERLSRRVLALAEDVATATGAELHVVHAWFVFGAEVLKHHVAAEELREAAAGAAQTAGERVEHLLRTVALEVRLQDVPPERVHTVEGVPERALPRFFVREQIDLAVVGTRGRRHRISRMLFPPLARQLLEQTSCSVVVVKP